MTWSCEFCTDQYKSEECFGNGKFCAPNHERASYSNIYGRDIIMEDLRMQCLHELLKRENREQDWWDYVKFVHEECYDFISGQCSLLGHKEINYDYDRTQKCVAASFENT